MYDTTEIIGLVLCFLGSSFFSGSEAVLMSISPDRVRQLMQKGGIQRRALTFMAEKPNEILTTILVGNNIVNILAASLMTTIAARIFQDEAVGISVGITTIIILVFGEVIPKTFARTHAEVLAIWVIRILQLCYYLIYPIVSIMAWFTRKVLGKNAQLHGRIITKDDIEFMIDKAEKEKTMDSKQIELLSSILEFPTIKVKDIMISRSKVKYLGVHWSFKQIMKLIKEDNHSRYPVCDDNDLDDVIGFLHVKDLAFVRSDEVSKFNIKKFLKPPFFVYEHMKIQAVFDHMNRKKVHLALVKDENGLVVGVVTLEDIIEEIFGEIQDEHDKEEDATHPHLKLSELEGLTIPGTISLRRLANEFDVKIPLNDNYSTLAGFILDMLGNNFPNEGQIIVWEGYSFELVNVVEHEIKEVKIKDVDGEKHLFSKKNVP